MKTVTFRNAAASNLFASVRGSRDVSLVAFGAALLAAVALHIGAFIPRVTAPEARQEGPAQLAAQAPAPAEVVAAQPAPCATPRG